MTKATKERLDKIKKKDLSNLNQREISTAKLFINKLFADVLPYTAKNGVRFSDNGVSLVTNHGIVFGDNSYRGGDSYGLMMRHIERAGDGSIAYDCSMRINSISKDTLESFAKVIEGNIRKNAEKALSSFK